MTRMTRVVYDGKIHLNVPGLYFCTPIFTQAHNISLPISVMKSK